MGKKMFNNRKKILTSAIFRNFGLSCLRLVEKNPNKTKSNTFS